jgi:oligopeptide transport system substrate-binding protein
MKKLLVLLMILFLPVSVFAQATFRIGNGAEPQSLDPHLITGVPEHRVYSSLFEGLVTYDPKTAEPIPGTAESWTISKDGLTYTFKLRKNAVWSDGTPITAKTVVDSWLRCLNPETAATYSSLMTAVVKGSKEYNTKKAGPETVGIKALDDKTFQMTLQAPAPYALGMLAHYAFGIVPIHAIQKYGKDWTKPQNWVSNGPFVLTEWRPQDKVIVKKNPKYWDAANVKLDQVVYYPIDDNNTAFNMYLNGELDWQTVTPRDRIEEAKKRPDFQNAPYLGTYYYIFNHTKPPFNDVRVRKAFSMAFNRKELVEKVTRGGELPAFAYVPPMSGYTPASGFKENPEQAKKLLAAAGFPDGKGFPKVTILYNTSESHKKIAEYFQQKWEQTLGVKVDIVNQEWKTYLDTRRDGRMGGFELCRAGWIGDYKDPYNFLFMWLPDNFDFNDGRYYSIAYDALVKKANTMPGSPERMKVFQNAEKILIEQDHGIMPIYYYATLNMIDLKKWNGWYSNVLDVHPTKAVSLKK